MASNCPTDVGDCAVAAGRAAGLAADLFTSSAAQTVQQILPITNIAIRAHLNIIDTPERKRSIAATLNQAMKSWREYKKNLISSNGALYHSMTRA
jgi:hypothetical protein